MAETQPIIDGKGTQEDQDLYSEVRWHYNLANQDLTKRRFYFDRADELVRTYIDKTNWPYKAVVAMPLAFQYLTEKTSRLIANKLQGKLYPRSDGDVVKAKIANEVLSYQWDCANEDGTMIQKVGMMDHLARKYGASFGVVYWKTQKKLVKSSNLSSLSNKMDKPSFSSEVIFDGPEFKVLPSRDVLANPSYSTIKTWFQYREWLTLEELEGIRTTDPKYGLKNLDMLRQSLNNSGMGRSDNRSTAYPIKNKSLKGNIDYLGSDKYFPVVEVVTEMRPDRWIKFAPRHGVILQDIPNPLENGEIPVVMLRYYPVDDDLYGLSELEPVEKLLRAMNAMTSQYLDAINTELYPPLQINPRAVQMHTIEFGPNKKWLMNTPGVDVQRMEMKSNQSVQAFSNTYQFMLSAIQSAFGETGAPVSSVNPFSPDKTATEVKDFASQRLARDNYNQIYLGEALKRLIMLWLQMDKNWLPKTFPLRIGDKETMQMLTRSYTVDGRTQLPQGQMSQGGQEDPAYITPVKFSGQVRNKFEPDAFKQSGVLLVERDDLSGDLEYVPDVASMSLQNPDKDTQNLQTLLQIVLNPVVMQMLMAEGVSPKIKELITELLEDEGLKDGERFFTSPNQQQQQVLQGMNSQPQKPQQQPKQPAESLSYKDAPPDIQRQIEQQAGLQPSQVQMPQEAQKPPVQVPFEHLPDQGKSQAAAMSGIQVQPQEFAQHRAAEASMEIASQSNKMMGSARYGQTQTP